MAKPNKIFLLLFAIVILILIYITPNVLIPLAKDKIHYYLEKTLQTRIILGEVGINIFTRSITLEDLVIENHGQFRRGDLLKANQIIVKPEILPLLKKKLIISRMVLDKPCLTLYRLATDETNWDFLWQKGKKQSQNKIGINELLIKDGTFIYTQEFSPEKTATAQSHGVFIHLKNYPSPISYIQNIPLSIRIKGKGYLPTDPKGVIAFSGNANLGIPLPPPGERGISFSGDISMDDISLTYFNNFSPQGSQIQVINGKFSLQARAQCIRDQLNAQPNVTVRDLQLKLTKDYATGDVFELPIMLVVDFFDIYKEELKFTFEVNGTLTDPNFQLDHVVAQKVSEVIGESIVRTIATSPALVEKLGDKLITIADKLKNLGLDIGKGAGKAIKQLEKPVKEFIKGLKGE